MKDFSKPAVVVPPRVIIPVVSELKGAIAIGELVYFMSPEFPGLYVYLGNRRWEGIFNSKNNIIETHEATANQQIFKLQNPYQTNGHSINVYVEGRRLAKCEYAEVDSKVITIKDRELLKGGEVIDFQLFNVPIPL